MSVLGTQGARDFLCQQVQVVLATRTEPRTFTVIPKRWIAERSFAWLEKTIDYGKIGSTSTKRAHSEAFGALSLRRL